MHWNFSIMHSLKHAQGHHLPLYVSLLIGISGAQLIKHVTLLVLQLLLVLGARLLALTASHASSSGVSLLRLSLLIEELGLQEIVGI